MIKHLFQIALLVLAFACTGIQAQDIALGKPGTASSGEGTYSPAKAVDGNSATRWGSAFGQPNWVMYDLGQTYSISRVRLNWERASAETYRIMVSSVNSTPSPTSPDWTTIISKTGMPDAARVDDLTGLSGSGRYIAMYGENRLHPWGFSLWDFEVYGSASTPPIIQVQPGDATVAAGQAATFTVIVTSPSSPPSYQWRKNGVNISGATSNSYTTPPAVLADNGSLFSVVVSNASGSVTSRSALLTVAAPLPVAAFSGSPLSGVAPLAVVFSNTSTNADTYSWAFGDGGSSTAANPSHTYAAAGSYTVSLTAAGPGGSDIETKPAYIVVSNPALPPSIITQPASQTVIQGQSAAFSVTASGSAPLAYQWRKNGANISGATSSSFTIAAAQPGDAGNYSVLVSNAQGSVTSANAALTVLIPPSIGTQPVSQSIVSGSPVTFSVSASGSAPLAYQWQKNGVNITGATSSAFSIASVVPADAGTYRVQVSNAAGSVFSNGANLLVLELPIITSQPAPVTIMVGETAAFSVTATGSAPLSYQWRKNGTNISGATASSYTTPAATLSDNGSSFSVVVTNPIGFTVSSNALLTVQPAGAVPNSQKIAISGELMDDLGNPLGYPTPVQVEATVRLYTDVSAGTLVYSETFLTANSQSITVEDGLFVARMGEGTASDALQTVLAAHDNLWVEITIESTPPDVLLPRTPLTSSAYSIR